MKIKTASEKLLELTELGYSQCRIAKATGVPQPTVCRIANGKHRDPSESKVRAIDDFYEKVLSSRAQAA